jgi:hypothetical protein
MHSKKQIVLAIHSRKWNSANEIRCPSSNCGRKANNHCRKKNFGPSVTTMTTPFGKRLTAFRKIYKMLRTAQAPNNCWQTVLDVTEQTDILSLSQGDIVQDIGSVANQLRSIWKEEPIPTDLRFFYFGLDDVWNEREQKEEAGFYVSGGRSQNAREELKSGVSYLPRGRYLSTVTLKQIKEVERQLPERQEMLDYAVMFGAGAIIAKFAIKMVGVDLPVYVGFDFGDYERVT